jgi:hypothetical protein
MRAVAALNTWIVERVRARRRPLPTRVGACANCGAAVDGAFCARCGQETAIELPTARQFLRDAAGRYVALDGRLWRTIAVLCARPGVLTREYLAGRRRRYVRPGRLFLVLSVALFAVLRLGSSAPLIIVDQADGSDAPRIAIGAAPPAPGSQGAPGGTTVLDIGLTNDLDIVLDEKSPAWLAPLRPRIAAFNALPREQKAKQLIDGMLRYGPYAAVALLPVFAVLMQLAYLGRHRAYPGRPSRYAAHLVFGAHNHAYMMLALLAFSLLPLGPVRVAVMLWSLAYLPWSMRTVYGGRWIGIAARLVVVAAIYLVCFVAACIGLIIAAVMLR